VRRGLLIAACAAPLLLAACGSGGKTPSTSPERCTRAIARLEADVNSLRRAADRRDEAALNRGTDRFLRDVALAPIDNKLRNRMIDHAAGALIGACEECFQALEAARPIPSIRLGDSGAGCSSA
jgi:outer membrane murein-binding lipoprotein Lpp